jgi:hypothetical protein
MYGDHNMQGANHMIIYDLCRIYVRMISAEMKTEINARSVPYNE